MKTQASSSSSSPMAVLTGLKLLLLLVFVGWLMLWVVMPTDFWSSVWFPKLHSSTKSFFGLQGTRTLIYTLPILFIALFGSIYLHVAKKTSNIVRRGLLNKVFEQMKRPVLMKGPMGILSAVELTFTLMFLALLVWCFSINLNRSFSEIDPNVKGSNLAWTKLKDVAFWSGYVGNIATAFLFFPVTRISSLLPLVGLTSEASIKYHIWIGHTILLLFSVHGFCFSVAWYYQGALHELWHWDPHGASILAGVIALLSGLIMWATTFARIRRKMFELFFYTHQLYALFMLFYLLHVGFSFFCLILPGVYLFLIDRYLRFLQSRQKVRLVSARLLPSEAFELNFSKSQGTSYNPLSVVFINVPSISALQWHPFTISSCSNLEPDRLSVIIKKEGSWTRKLYQMLSSPSSPDRIAISLEGPYGPASIDFLSFDSLVLVSGGSGITPFFSIIRELIHRSSTLDMPTPSVLLVCAFKTLADLTMLDLLLPISGEVTDLSRIRLSIEAFVTREKAPAANAREQLRTKWFKPLPSDKPVTHVLGSDNWLWLCIVIASSFVAYLVLLAILTHYYLGSESIDTSYRALVNLLLIWVCIAATGGAAVVWNKKGSSMELKQIRSTETTSPVNSPTSWFYNADRELESMPHESIAQSTNVHYGTRPDLKKILLDCKDKNTGVMASGPSRLRQEVASICSSSEAKNLHIESISFSW